MSVLPVGIDRAAIQELEELFRSADPANTGLLSYTEFAYLILRSGGTQEQVDALIEQFAGSSRSQRVVYYGALLEQLYDSVEAAADAHAAVENGGARHISSPLLRTSSLDRASLKPPLDTSDNSPLPIPPVPTCAAPSSWYPPPPLMPGGGATAAATAAPPDVIGTRRHDAPPAVSSCSPFYRSITHAGASGSGTSTLGSRESSTATHATYTALHDRQLSQLRSNSSRASFSNPPSGPSSPYSSRFVEFALRTATAAAAVPLQQQRLGRAPSRGSTHPSLSASRSRSRDGLRSTALTGSPMVGTEHGESARAHSAMSAPHGAAGTGRYPCSLRVYHPTSADIERRHRESSTERMVRAAVEVSIHGRSQPCFDAEGRAGTGKTHESEEKRGSSVTRVPPGAQPAASSSSGAPALHFTATHRANHTAEPRAKSTSASFTEYRASESDLCHVNPSGHSSHCSSAATASLLSLRDIFQRYLAPKSSRDGTVLLSELEETLTRRGVNVHPLELEAVADSLELSTVPGAIERHGSTQQHHSFNTSLSSSLGALVATAGYTHGGPSHHWTSVNASGMDSTDASATTASRTTITGGADRALNLVDFCVLVSRLRPALIQHIRSPSVWESITSIEAVKALRRCQPPTGNDRLGGRAVGEANDGDRDDGASIADVTVSPMTPTTTAPATPRSTTSSSSPQPRSSAQHHRQKQRSLVRHRFSDPRRSLSATKMRGAAESTVLSAALPTARQLSADQQFSVEHAQHEPQRSQPRNERGDDHHGSARYAHPTVVSQQRRSGLHVPSITTAPLRRTKVPLWQDELRASARRSHTSATHLPSSTSRGSSGGSISPDERHYPQEPRSRCADVSFRNPASDLSTRVVREEWGTRLASRDAGGTLAPSPTTASAQFSPTCRSPPSPPSASKWGLPSSTLAPRLLEALQSASLALLRRCTQLDSRRTGRIAPSTWLRVLREACPTLTDAERLRAQEWIRARGQGSASGDDYAAVVEDILTEANLAPLSPASGTKRSAVWRGDSTAATSSPHTDATRTHSRPQEQGTAGTRSPVPPTSAVKGASTASSLSATKPLATVRRRPRGRASASASPDTSARAQRTDADAKRLLAHELMTACGGDTEALVEYFRAFDVADTGLLDERVWRASLEELFRRTEGKEAPAWVVGGCVRLSRMPLEITAATPSQQRGTPLPASPVLSAARARVSRVPPAMRHRLCDYRYVLEELGVHADG
ncbi:hypothetical protein LPMP_250990 [Leishmania panamensis]|uniref:EF-hand domain-containing protein n=1 Tax=Leishmania panamensis TaxID=5679 RepID=A0A088SBC0_LEIPA|nr:hypothetical protein LPMP_250990 [Leishmania panamensis]AIN98961.1 hypothetical protein LPMP_250990 [Leishmania panamensis]